MRWRRTVFPTRISKICASRPSRPLEKAIKAMLIRSDVDFPYVHDLARLLSLLEEAGEAIPDIVRKAGELTPYALITRYPGPARPVTQEEYEDAVKTSEAVVQWTEGRL